MLAPVRTVGDLSPEDDFMHTVSDDPSHNESMFFNFFDTKLGLGGFVRIGNRVNEGHAEMTLCIFLPGGELLFQWGKAKITSNAAFDAAGLKFIVVEPGRRFRVTYSGSAVRIIGQKTSAWERAAVARSGRSPPRQCDRDRRSVCRNHTIHRDFPRSPRPSHDTERRRLSPDRWIGWVGPG